MGLVQAILADARAHALPLQLVLSSRRPGAGDFDFLEVGPLSEPERLALAARVKRNAGGGADGADPDLLFGAAELFQALGRATAPYKRALLLACEQRISFAEYARRLREAGSLEDMEQVDPTLASLNFERQALESLQDRHGFAYGLFLSLLYRFLISRAAYFSLGDLVAWFGDALKAGGAGMSTEIAYRNGLSYLVRLNFLAAEERRGSQVFTLPPNQRWNLRALADDALRIPDGVPLRGADERLSLALERASRGDLGAIGELLDMESDYARDLHEPGGARAVFYSRMVRAQLAKEIGEQEAALRILASIPADYDRHASTLRHRVESEEPVAQALVNKGVTLGALGRPEEAMAVYDEVVRRYADRPEAPLAEPVAQARLGGWLMAAQAGSAPVFETLSKLVDELGASPHEAVRRLAAQVAGLLSSKQTADGA